MPGHAEHPLPLRERVARMSRAKFEPGEGLRSIEKPDPLTRFLTTLETNLSRKGRGLSRRTAGVANSHDPDRHIRQAIELTEQHVALDHGADILRRAGIDDVAGLQLEGFRQLRDLLGDAPDHLVEI